MRHKVFQRGNAPRLLNARGVGQAHLCNKQAVFAESFFHPTPPKFACKVEIGCKYLPCTNGAHLLAHVLGHALDKRGVESCALRNGLGKDGAAVLHGSVYAFEHGNERNAQSGAVHSVALDGGNGR